MCYFASGCEHSYTHSTCLECMNREKQFFSFCGRCHLFKQHQREQCDVSNHICYASHSILPTRRASREVGGTVEQQPSLECMCHNGINSEPWLMFYIYNHPSQLCHRNGQRTRVSSWCVWLIQFSVGPILHITFFRVFPKVTMLSLFMASESKCSLRVCAKLSNLQRSDINWCIFWTPAALSTATSPVCTDTMENECLRETEREGKVARKGGSLHPGL